MNDRPTSTLDVSASVTLAILLLLTAWGNAKAMLVVAAVALLVWLFVNRRLLAWRTMIVGLLSCVLAVVIAMLTSSLT